MGDRRSRLAVLMFLVTALGNILASPAARAMTVTTVDFMCPLCQTHFRKQMTSSSTSWGQRLDLIPIGNASFPWPVARCPKCRLVLYKPRFTPRELARLRPIVYSDEYRALGERSGHYALAKLRERLGAKDLELAHTFLNAAAGSQKHSSEWTDAMSESLRYFEKFLRTAPPRDSPWATAALLRGEILRQLARFAEAEAHFRSLRARSAFVRSQFDDFVEQELQLIAARDSEPHIRGEPSPARLRELAQAIIEKTPGTAAIQSEFLLEGEHVSMDEFNSHPRWLYVDRIVPRGAPFDLAASISQGEEEDRTIRLDWKAFLDVYRPLRAAAARHRWLAEWLKAGPQRQAIVTLSRWRSSDPPGLSQDWDALYPKLTSYNGRVSPSVKEERRYKVELRCGEKVAARLELAAGDRPVLVTEILGCDKSEHFLDRQQPFAEAQGWYFQKYLLREYLVIEPDGRFVRVSERAPGISCPKELCTEPCQPRRYGCSGPIWLSCPEGKIVLIDLSNEGKRPYTCGDRPDGRKGELGLAGASCDPLLAPEDGPEFCAPGLTCVNGTCEPVQTGATSP